MTAPRLYTPEAVAVFLAMCRNRQPRDLIAARLGWTVRQVTHLHEHLQRHGRQRYALAHRSRRRAGRISPLAGREAEIAELSRRDHSAKTIAELLGVTVSQAGNYMSYHGLFALHRRRHRRGLLPVSLRRLATPMVDEADVRLAIKAWAELEDVA